MCSLEGPPRKRRKPHPFPHTEPLPIYLDYNATTPICHEAWEMMGKVRHAWGNPSSTHPFGLTAKYYLEKARTDLAKLVDSDNPESFIFTSGGTEGNNMAIVGGSLAIRSLDSKRNVIISSNVEHPSVAEVLKTMHKFSFEVYQVPANSKTGELEPEKLSEFLDSLPEGPSSVALATIMHANNELGTINPIGKLVDVVKKKCGSIALFHTDAAQSAGKIKVSLSELNVDLMTLVSHKFYGPKGVGSLYIKSGLKLPNLLHGAGHELGRRPGTENVLLITGMVEALRVAIQNIQQYSGKMKESRNELLRSLEVGLKKNGMGVSVNGDILKALPNTLNCAIFKLSSDEKANDPVYISSKQLIEDIGDIVCMSTGSACHSDGTEVISAPLAAIGASIEQAKGTLRLSTGRETTLEDVHRAARIIVRKSYQQFYD